MSASPTRRAGAEPARPSTIEIDRREFLKLTAAAGLTAAGSTLLGTAAFGQSQAPSASGAPAAADLVADLAASLDHDQERIFRFVSDEIRYEPYAGILRGPKGTLTARAGNSADKAVLLAAMLDAAGVSYRYAVGSLHDEPAARLEQALGLDLASAREDALGVLALPGNEPGIVSSEDAETQAFLEEANTDTATVIPTASRQLDVAVETILAALAADGVALTTPASSLPMLERDSHVWLQSGSGGLDLDPTMTGARPGETLATARESLDVLPEDLRHRVEISAIAEMIIGGQLQEFPILDFAEASEALAEVPIVFTNVKGGDLGIGGFSPGGFMSGTTQYNAVLTVGQRTIIGVTPITFNPEGGGDFFGSLGGGGPVDGETTAEWLEIRVHSPGRDPVSVRREIFDRVGLAAREAGGVDVAVIPAAELVDLDADAHSQAYPPCLAVHALAIVGGPVGASTFARARPSTEDIGTLSLVAQAYHSLRDALFAEVGLVRGVRPFIDAPNIASWSLGASADGPGGGLARTVSFDIWHRSFGHLPVSDVAPIHPPAVVAGVLSHIAERVALRDGIGSDPRSVIGVGSLFEEAARLGIGMSVLRADGPIDAVYGPDAIARIRLALAGGHVVVIPEQPIDVGGRPRVGWWVADPVSGRVVDQMDDGRGVTTAEKVELEVILSPKARFAFCMLALAEKILAIAALSLSVAGYRTAAAVVTGAAIFMWFVNFFNPRWAGMCRSGVSSTEAFFLS